MGLSARAAWIGNGFTELVKVIGKNRLVLDLSCRRRGEDYFVVTDRWQKFTELAISPETLQKLAGSCAEFLIHAVDVEGLCRGIDRELVEKLGRWTPIPTTYAGGANSLSDLEEVTRLGQGKVDLTIGSALDIFGGNGVKYEDVRKIQPPPDGKIRRRLSVENNQDLITSILVGVIISLPPFSLTVPVTVTFSENRRGKSGHARPCSRHCCLNNNSPCLCLA